MNKTRSVQEITFMQSIHKSFTRFFEIQAYTPATKSSKITVERKEKSSCKPIKRPSSNRTLSALTQDETKKTVRQKIPTTSAIFRFFTDYSSVLRTYNNICLQ